MAMTAWAAKVWRSAICFSVNGWTTSPADHDGAERHAFSQQRHHQSLSGFEADRARMRARVSAYSVSGSASKSSM